MILGNHEIKHVGVVGAGAMGSQIAMVAALSGFPVFLQDISIESIQKAEAFLREQMERRVKKGSLPRSK